MSWEDRVSAAEAWTIGLPDYDLSGFGAAILNSWLLKAGFWDDGGIWVDGVTVTTINGNATTLDLEAYWNDFPVDDWQGQDNVADVWSEQ